MPEQDERPIARGYSEATAAAMRRDQAAGLSRTQLREKYGVAVHTLGEILAQRGCYAVKESNGFTLPGVSER